MAEAKGITKESFRRHHIQLSIHVLSSVFPTRDHFVGGYCCVLVVDEFSAKLWSFFLKKRNKMDKTVSELLCKLSLAGFH